MQTFKFPKKTESEGQFGEIRPRHQRYPPFNQLMAVLSSGTRAGRTDQPESSTIATEMDLSTTLGWFLDLVRGFSQSEMFSTAVAGAAGAAAGALGAQAVISRGQARQAVVTELNTIRAALVLCFSITNQFLSLKRQLVRPMRNRYVQMQQEHEAFQAAARIHKGPQPLVFELHADFQTIVPIRVPYEVLEHYVYEGISVPPRGLAASVSLASAIDGLELSIQHRNELITEFQRTSPNPPDQLAERYLGLRTADGTVDEKFKNSVEAIYTQTDDCIFFSRILADDLLEYGNKLRRRWGWRFRLRTRKLQPADWSIAETAGLIPPNEQYADWLRGFRKAKRWWQS